MSMRKISLLMMVALFCQSDLQTFAKNDNYELKAEQPILDARAETKMLFARINQIERAQTGDKLPLKLLGIKTAKSAPVQAIQVARVTSSVPIASNLIATKFDLNDVYAGRIQILSNNYFANDPSLNIRLRPGERGFTVIRFEKSTGGNLRLHPPTLFFAGREYESTLAKTQHQQSTNVEISPNSFFENVYQNLTSWFPWLKGSSSDKAQREQMDYVYVPLGNVASHNKLGHYFIYNVVSTNTKISNDKVMAQDEVTEVQTNDPTSPTKYYEAAIRIELTAPGKAHIKIARVQYAGDRTILRRQIFEGNVSTKAVSSVQGDIVSQAKTSWADLTEQFHL